MLVVSEGYNIKFVQINNNSFKFHILVATQAPPTLKSQAAIGRRAATISISIVPASRSRVAHRRFQILQPSKTEKSPNQPSTNS